MLPIEKFSFDGNDAGADQIFRADVDLTVLRDYESIQLAGEPDLIVELIDLYLADAPRRVAAMRESAAMGSWPLLKREAHSLRGSSGNLGALQVGRICGEIEKTKSEDHLMPKIEALLTCLDHELERVHHIFMAERQERSQ